jgi:epoxide hydrolase-like predicted phosphatase
LPARPYFSIIRRCRLGPAVAPRADDVDEELRMPVRAVVFDIGGVLEFTPPMGVTDRWEKRLGLAAGELRRRLHGVLFGGSIGTLREAEVYRSIGEILGVDAATVDAYMQDTWTEYLGSLNAELARYFAGLRPRYRTALLSNSFVGAREREQHRYGFQDMTDLIVYSHEVGMAKPDPRIYRLTCQRLGVPPAETLFLDDTQAIVDGALDVGLQAILFQDTAQAIADIETRLAA